MSFPVCTRALEIARMEDKSRLGKPVKIYQLGTCDEIKTGANRGRLTSPGSCSLLLTTYVYPAKINVDSLAHPTNARIREVPGTLVMLPQSGSPGGS